MLLGAPDEGTVIVTTKLGIKLQANGYDRQRPNPIRKTTVKLTGMGLSILIPEFTEVANDAPNMLARIDELYTAQVAVWVKCGGIYAKAAQLDPKRLTVTIEPAPFTHPFYGPDFQIAGITEGDKIRIVVMAINSKSQFLQHWKNLLSWECGNWAQLNILGTPKNLEGEIGNKSPCG